MNYDGATMNYDGATMNYEELRNLYAAVVMHALIGRGNLGNGAEATAELSFEIAEYMIKVARRNSDGTYSE
jgi:hypothetical protein